MTRDEVLLSLFGPDHGVAVHGHGLFGQANLPGGQAVHVLGFGDHAELGVDEALVLAGQVLDIVRSGDGLPIVMLVDSSSQRMSRRDELMGLNECLGHLAKALRLAEQAGCRTVGVLYGGSAAGAFIATALACGVLVGLPGAHPEVMDLPSMARVTKLPLETLQKKAEASPVFAPGLDNLVKTGGVTEVWNPLHSLAPQLEAVLADWPDNDRRAALGQARGARPQAAAIADEVLRLALAHA
jgi:malonate decarboxylase gamma subunit